MSTPRLIVHIGLHKTGTTFMQEQLFPRIARSDARLVYNPPEVLGRLRAIYSQMHRGNYPDDDQIGDFRRHLEESVERAGRDDRRVLISLERISQSLRRQNHSEHFDFFRKAVPAAVVVVVLRHQLQWIRSCYRQFIAGGALAEFDELFGTGLKDGREYLFDLARVDYPGLVANYIDHCGRDHVEVFFYEKVFRDPPAFEQALGRVLGGCPIPKIDYSARANPGLSGRSIRMLVRVARLGGYRFETGQLRRRMRYMRYVLYLLRRLDRWLPPGKDPIGWARLDDAWAGVFRAQNQRLDALLGGGVVPPEYLE